MIGKGALLMRPVEKGGGAAEERRGKSDRGEGTADNG